MPKKQTYRLEQIDWEDANSQGAWHRLDKDYQATLLVVHSTGWLIKETEKIVVLAQQMSANGSFADTITIPKNCIMRRCKLPIKYSVRYEF